MRDAVSKAIFFADGNSKRSAAASRRFLRPLTGNHAAHVAALTGQPDLRVAQDDATIAELFSVKNAVESVKQQRPQRLDGRRQPLAASAHPRRLAESANA